MPEELPVYGNPAYVNTGTPYQPFDRQEPNDVDTLAGLMSARFVPEPDRFYRVSDRRLRTYHCRDCGAEGVIDRIRHNRTWHANGASPFATQTNIQKMYETLTTLFGAN